MGALAFVLPSVDTPVVPSALSISAAPLQSGSIGEDDDLILAVSVSNATRKPVSDASVTVYLDRTPIPSATALNSWLHPQAEEKRGSSGSAVLRQKLPDLVPGQTRNDTLIVPAAKIRLTHQPWGVHRVTVRVTSPDSDAGETRTSVVWYPGKAVPSTPLAIVMPITVPAGTVGLLSAEDLAEYTAAGGALDRQLSQAIGRPIALGIDPRILASIRILGTQAPPSATAWLQRLQDADNETFALSYADSDIAALAQLQKPPLGPIGFTIDPDRFAPAPTESSSVSAPPSPSPSPTSPTPSATPIPTLPTPQDLVAWDYTQTGIAWPGAGTVTAKDLDVFSAAGLKTTLLDSNDINLGADDPIPGATATIGSHRVAVASNALSTLMQQAVTATDDLSWRAAVAELSSTLALAGPGKSGPVLVTLGRDFPPSALRLTQTLDALQKLPWTISGSLGEALASAPVSGALVPKPEAEQRLRLVKSMLDSEESVGRFATVLKDPTLVTGPQRLSLLAVLSHAWDSDPAGWKTATERYLADNQAIIASVNIAEGSTINLVAANGNLPITVSNALGHAVTVYVTVRPESAILSVMKNHIPLTIEADSQARVYIPVQSVANGQVDLGVSLTSASGVQVSLPIVVGVNVQADWERLATGIIAGILVAIFGFGIWRNIAKRRRARREQASVPAEAVELHE